MVVLSQAGPTNFVVIVVDPNHNVGALLYHLREDEPALAALL
jgi:predicted regulator of Ras-like GTPase activity (Roadblock/LC7/MglB family)